MKISIQKLNTYEWPGVIKCLKKFSIATNILFSEQK